jgi:predicted homoserine dehydrogenase-like protein
MQLSTLFAPAREKPVSAGLIGCGEFGLSLIAQSRRMDGLDITAVLDRDLDRVVAALAAAGVPAQVCDDLDSARAAREAGAIAICPSIDHLLGLPIEIVVEATGDPEAGARFAEAPSRRARALPWSPRRPSASSVPSWPAGRALKAFPTRWSMATSRAC